jgi:ornithine decarboxylase
MIARTEVAASSVYRSARPVIGFGEARRLADRYGGPLLVVSRSAIARNYRALEASLPGVELFYAVKANPHREVLRTLRGLGSSVDVASPDEARRALRAGFAPGSMIHTHPCKSVANLVDSYALGVRWFTFDSTHELPKLARHAPDASLLLRLAVSSSSCTVDLSAKFGAGVREALPLLRRARRMGLQVRGLSFHVGSQCLSPDDFASALREVRPLWDEAQEAGLGLEVLDVGGGIPAPYRQAVLSLEDYGRALSAALREVFGDLPRRVVAEPGRCLCAEAVTLITSVVGKTVRRGLPWYLIDDGVYGSFSGRLYDHADFPLLVERARHRPLSPCVVAGPTCDSIDVVARDQLLPDLEVGELLLVPSMGAYTSASASRFNGLGPARCVAID